MTAPPDSALVNDQADSGRDCPEPAGWGNRTSRALLLSAAALQTHGLPRARIRRRLRWPSGPIDPLAAPPDLLRQFLVAPHPIAVAAALAFGLFWGRAGAPLLLGRPGVWFGLLLGVVAYPFTQIWLRGELTRAVLDIVADYVGAAAMHEAVALVGLISAIVAAYGDEFAKLIMLLVVAFVMARPSNPRAVTAAAVAPAAGYALFAAQLSLSQSLESPVPTDVLAFAFIREWAWVALQFGTALPVGARLAGWPAGCVRAAGWRPCTPPPRIPPRWTIWGGIRLLSP